MELKDKICAELENIKKVLDEIQNIAGKKDKPVVELAGIGKFLVFRHFFVHAYGFMLDENELSPLIESTPLVFNQFNMEIEKFK